MLVLLIALAALGFFAFIANLFPVAGNVMALLKYEIGPVDLILLIMRFIV